ncbi:hypothetical protein ACNPNP_11125 [Microbacterium sp. AGC85]
MPNKIDSALRERAVRLVLEHRAEYPSTANLDRVTLNRFRGSRLVEP